MKVKVIEVEATKLDKDASYIIVFSKRQLSQENMFGTARQLDKLGIKAVYTDADDPETALKVYQIPSVKD